MGKKEKNTEDKVPPFYVTPISYSLSKEHTISAIESLVVISTDFRSLFVYGHADNIDKDNLRSTIESILDDMVVEQGESVERIGIAKRVITHYMTNVNELMKLGRNGEGN